MRYLQSELETVTGVTVLSGGDGNELFVSMDDALAEALHAKGHAFYAWPSLPKAFRLVTSFITEQEEIDEFVVDIQTCSRP